MKRMAIFVYYDNEGKVYEYVKCLLDGISACVTKLIIVVNGTVDAYGRELFEKYTDNIIFRDNIGYDAGAYKDVILLLKHNGELYKYDELVLMNDTYFGFFGGLSKVFDRFESDDSMDYYGITRHPEGEFGEGYRFNSHIQAYFLVISKRLLHSEDFIEFWNRLSYPADYNEAVFNFEIGLSDYITEKGYKKGAYSDIGEKMIYNKNPYIVCPDQLIEEYDCPILKIKSLFIENEGCMKAHKVLDYLSGNTLFDVEIVLEYLMQKSKKNKSFSYFNIYELEQFCTKYNKLYIYGAGKYGICMKKYLEYRDFEFVNFIVSDKKNNSEEMLLLDEFEVNEDVGIIVGMGVKSTKEVLPELLKRVSVKQIFTGNHMK